MKIEVLALILGLMLIGVLLTFARKKALVPLKWID